MIFGFQHFHPLKGSPPNDVHWFGGDIVFRARALLRGRNLTQIKAILSVANWLIAHSPVKALALEELEKLIISIDEQKSASSKKRKSKPEAHIESQNVKLDLGSDVTALRLCVDRFNLSEYPNIPDLRWSELFAALALGLIDKAKDDEEFYGRGGEDDTGYFYAYRVSTHVSFWLMFAMDAVSSAEGLAKELQIASVAKAQALAENSKKISLRNKKAAIEKHAKTTSALYKLREFYLSKKFKSQRNAAQIFSEEFPDVVAHLAPTNRVRTLSEGLSKLLVHPLASQ